jgi:multidrug efflux pump
MTQTEPKEGFNLSKWALDHPALTRYLMVVLMLLGFAAYFQLGQDEDPPFTFRAMVVRTYWPGATAQQVAEQVTDKIERTLQEVPYADKIRSYSKPGESQIIFQIKDSSQAPPRCPTSGTRCARRWATCASPCRQASRGRSSTTSLAMCMA